MLVNSHLCSIYEFALMKISLLSDIHTDTIELAVLKYNACLCDSTRLYKLQEKKKKNL